jgi:outer membrane lipoprotein LolB
MRSWLVALLLPMLAACAGVPEVVGPLGPPLESFNAVGRLALHQGERSDHLAFEWRHDPQGDRVLFSTPLGQGVAELGRDPSGAWLEMPGQAMRRAADLRELARQLFGAPLPLDVLARWLAGERPEPSGRVEGWDLLVTEDAPYGQRRLPRRIELRKGETELRIVIQSWGSDD